MRNASLSLILVGLVLATLGFSARAEVQTSKTIPDCVLEIAVRMRSEGKFDEGIHNLILECSQGSCRLTTLSLNQCGRSGSGARAFYPRVAFASTAEGTLSVQRNGNTLQVTQRGSDFGGAYTTSLIFGFVPVTGTESLLTVLSSFSGGFVKNSDILKRVVTAEYEPLRGRNQVVPMECGVLLRGISTER